MKVKLHWKLTFLFCVILFFGLLIGYFYLKSHINNYFNATIQDNLKRQLILAKDFIETYADTNLALINKADDFADRIGEELGLRVTIITPNGTVIGDTELDKKGLESVENHSDRPEIQEALKNSFGTSKRYSYTLKKYMLYMAVPLGETKHEGVLRISVPVSQLVFMESKPHKIIVVALLIIFLLSLTFTFLISFFVSKPLVEIIKIAKTMAMGDLSEKPSIYSRDEIGELARALSLMSDEIKDKIERIRQEGAKIDTVLSSMLEGIIVTDENGKIILLNPAIRKLFFVDMSPDGKEPIEIIRNISIQNMVDKLLKGKNTAISEEITINQPEERIFKVNGVPIIRNNIFEGAVLVFHDITELRRLEKIRQDFVANVSHELRTPMASIKGYAETLLEGALEDKDNLKDFIKIIYSDSNRLANLIDDLLDLSKIESGKMRMMFEPLEVTPILKRCLGILEKMIKDKNLSVVIDMRSDLPKVLADEKRLLQVFLNLLDNAVKYTPEKGTITISAYPKGKLIQISIRDTGIGISEKDISRIFERFYRVDKARSRELGGTGLGLSIVKHIVLAHSGEIWVESKIASGSAFSFTIPQA